MGFKTGSYISIANRGLNPQVSSALTRAVRNPLWNFASPRTVIITFKESGSWLCPTGVTEVEYLVVAGGGGGGGHYGGGGGAGGFRTGTGLSVTAGNTYTVTVGAGGTAGTAYAPATRGGSGANSTFSTITSNGGGGGGTRDGTIAGANGGSGVVIIKFT